MLYKNFTDKSFEHLVHSIIVAVTVLVISNSNLKVWLRNNCLKKHND